MSCAGVKLAAAAAGLVGAPFRLGGREATAGLDCVGLVVAALEAIGREVEPLPRYSLRQHDVSTFVALAKRQGLRVARIGTKAGDILLLRPSPEQNHLAIRQADGSIVHAHAGLRKVVITPSPIAWPVVRCWRLA